MARTTPWPGSGLHVCPSCHGDFVYAEDRSRDRDARWRMRLRCGQCESSREVVIPDDLALRFDADVERGLAAIAAGLLT